METQFSQQAGFRRPNIMGVQSGFRVIKVQIIETRLYYRDTPDKIKYMFQGGLTDVLDKTTAPQVAKRLSISMLAPVTLLSEFNKLLFGCFDPVNIIYDNNDE